MKGLIATLLFMAGLGSLLLGIGCLKDSKKNEKNNADFEKRLEEMRKQTEQLEKLIQCRQKEAEKQEAEIRQLNLELINILKGKYPNVVIM